MDDTKKILNEEKQHEIIKEAVSHALVGEKYNNEDTKGNG